MEISKKTRRDYDKPAGPRRDYDRKPTAKKSFGPRTEKKFGPKSAESNDSEEGRKSSFGRSAKPAFGRKPASRGEKPAFGEKRSFGDKPAARSEKPVFGHSEKPTFGRKPAASKAKKETPMEPSYIVRLNKFIANSGVCSRREADRIIESGAVTVNGKPVTELGVKINIRKDVVLMGDQRLKGEEKVYILMNKPKGFVTTTSDPHADQTVMDLLTKCPNRVFPVGRLDKNTTGVLMFTNDGELSEKLTHPSFNKKKIYEVSLDRKLTEEDFDKILSGINLEDGPIAADELSFTDAADRRKVGIEIHSGKNRIVRRIFESLGYQVKNLDRVYFAGLTKKGLKRGQWRYLTEGEVSILKMGAYN